MTSSRQLSAAVRNLATLELPHDIERVAVDALVELLHVDFASFSRREHGVWRNTYHRGFSTDLLSLRIPDEKVDQLEELMAGRTVEYEFGDGAPRLKYLARSADVATSLAVPILLEGELRGSLSVARRTPTAFTQHEYAIVEIIAAQCVARLREKIAAERLREALARQRAISNALQRTFIPKRLPNTPDFAFDAVYVPAEEDALVGGDWYDAFILPSERIAFSIGDVTGHGIDAAATMGRIRQAIVTAALDDSNPVSVLQKVNYGVLNFDEAIATAIVGFIDLRTSTFSYASAGHPAPILVGSGKARSLPCGGLPLGVQANLNTAATIVNWRPGDLFLLYTDGVSDVQRDSISGEQALLKASEFVALRSAIGSEATEIFGRVLGGLRLQDDAALLTIRWR